MGSDDSEGESRHRRRGRPKIPSKDSIKGFSESDIRRFIKSYKKFPFPMKRLDSIAIDAELQEKPMADLKRLAELLQTSCENAVKEYQAKQLKDAQFDDAASELSLHSLRAYIV